MMAAAAAAALDHTLPKIARVHSLTKAAAGRIQELGYKFALPIQTNMIVIDLPASGIPPAALVAACERKNIAALPSGRMVFHHQTSTEGVESLIEALRELMDKKNAGETLESYEVQGGCS